MSFPNDSLISTPGPGCAAAAPSRTPATLSDVILAVNYALGSDLLKNIAQYRYAADSPFQEWIEKHPRDAVHLGRDLETRLMVVVDPATSPRCMYRLVYDGRNQIFPEEGGGFWPERGVILTAAPRLRMVTHLDVRPEHVEPIVESFAAFVRA